MGKLVWGNIKGDGEGRFIFTENSSLWLSGGFFSFKDQICDSRKKYIFILNFGVAETCLPLLGKDWFAAQVITNCNTTKQTYRGDL